MDFQSILLSVRLKRPEAARCPTRQNKDNGWKDIRLVLALHKNNVSRLRIQRTGYLVSQIGMRRPVSRGMRYAPNDVLKAQRKGDRQCRRLALCRRVEKTFSKGS